MWGEVEIFWVMVKNSFLCRPYRERNNEQWIGLTTAEQCTPGVFVYFKCAPWQISALKYFKNHFEHNFSHLVKFCGSPCISLQCTLLAPKMIFTGICSNHGVHMKNHILVSESKSDLWLIKKPFGSEQVLYKNCNIFHHISEFIEE